MPDTQDQTRYSIAGQENAAIRMAIVAAIQTAARGREQQSALNTVTGTTSETGVTPASGNGAPANVWDMGTSMYEDGINHLPAIWRTQTCPKDLHLGSVPTFNFYKRIVEVIRSSVLKSMPGIEFGVEKIAGDAESEAEVDAVLTQAEGAMRDAGVEIPASEDEMGDADAERNAEIVTLLNRLWEEVAQDSRLLAELDLAISHNCNYGLGFIGIQRGKRGKDYIRAVHPQLVIYDPAVERIQDMDWVCKVVVKPQPTTSPKTANAVFIDGKWPDSITNRPMVSAVFIEIWVLRGAIFAGRNWEDHGAHIVLRSDGQLVSENAWDLDSLPLLPIALLPGDRLRGEALAQTLWQSQVRVDKMLAVVNARVSRAAGEKYWLQTANGGPTTPGVGLTGTVVRDLEQPGTKVVFSEARIEQLKPVPVPKDLQLLYREAIADMERLAGISQAFQGMAPKSITAGVAIQTLAENSARRVNRMAMHMAESLRLFGKMWAAYELAKRGMELPPDLTVKVTLAVQEEQGRREQFNKIREIAEVWDKLPAEILEIVVESIPDLTPTNKDKLMKLLERRKEMEQRAQEAQQAEQEQMMASQGEPGAPQEPAQASEGRGGQQVPVPAAASTVTGPMIEPGAATARPRLIPEFLR